MKLRNVSDDAFHPDNKIKVLDLSDNFLTDIEFITGSFTHLQALIVKSNMLTFISNTAFSNQSWLAGEATNCLLYDCCEVFGFFLFVRAHDCMLI